MPIKKNGKWKKTKAPGIWEIGPQRFLVRARWTDTKSGRRKKREVIAKSFADAVLLQDRLKGAGPENTPIRMRFADYAAQWMREHGNGEE